MTEVITTFDAGTPGSDLVAGANGIQSTPDALMPKFINGIHGVGVRSGSPTNTDEVRFRVDLGVSGNHFGSAYFKCNTLNASTFVTFMSWVNTGNSIMASLRVGSDRAFNIRVGASTIVRAGSANEIPVGSWFRVDWQVTGTTINWRLFYNPEAPATDTPSLSGNFTFTTATISRLVLGANASTAITKDWSYDTVRARDTGSWYGPYGPYVTVWNGTAEVTAAVSQWNGSSEIQGTIGSIV